MLSPIHDKLRMERFLGLACHECLVRFGEQVFTLSLHVPIKPDSKNFPNREVFELRATRVLSASGKVKVYA